MRLAARIARAYAFTVREILDENKELKRRIRLAHRLFGVDDFMPRRGLSEPEREQKLRDALDLRKPLQKKNRK